MSTMLKSARERQELKVLRDQDAALAMREYEAEKLAVLAKTARLRALRLAKGGRGRCGHKPTAHDGSSLT